MQNRLTSRRRPGGVPNKTTPPAQGNTIPAQGETQDRVPRMPHERDESADAQPRLEPSAKRLGEQAHDDLADGLIDTSKAPELDATYDKVRGGEPKKRL